MGIARLGLRHHWIVRWEESAPRLFIIYFFELMILPDGSWAGKRAGRASMARNQRLRFGKAAKVSASPFSTQDARSTSGDLDRDHSCGDRFSEVAPPYLAAEF